MATYQPTASTQKRLSLAEQIGYYRLRTLLLTAVTTLVTIVFMWPFFTLVGISLNKLDVPKSPLLPWPQELSFQAYSLMFSEYQLHVYIFNTIYVVVITALLGTFFSALAGYALAKLRFWGRKALFVLVIAFMLLPLETMLVPQYIVLRDLKLLNTFWGLILPTVGGNAFGIFLMRQFMLQIPGELLDAGRVDGCTELGLFTRLVVPNMKGPILVLVTISVRGAWNQLLWPQIVLTSESKQLLMPVIARINGLLALDPYAQYVVLAAALVGALVPLAVYLYSQRFFVSALTGAIKG